MEDENSWESVYENPVETLPWFDTNLDHDLEDELKKIEINSGTFLDVGTGPGTQAIALAKKGFNVSAIDISANAIAKARLRAKNEKQDVEFIQDNILKTSLKKQFNYIFDRGCFHHIAPESRKIYVKNTKKLLKSPGLFFLKCFSIKETAIQGPYKFSKQDIINIFGADFNIIKVIDSFFHGNLTPKALWVVMKKSNTV